MKTKLSRLLRSRRFVAGVLITVGILITAVYGVRSVRSYREFQYARESGLLDGTASVEAIRPWMTFRYVSVAYGVPEEYLFAQLEIPFERRNSNQTLGELNRMYDFGPPQPPEASDPSEADEAPNPPDLPLTSLIQEAISTYQENPVVTGLDDIRPWMTIRYVANSTGVPEAYILEQLGLASDDNTVFKPLNVIAEEIQFEGGPRAFDDHIANILEQYEVEE
ncbi:MAG: hypothetical protein KDE51_01120 [Anaerolineales bacterium]|nr:hypothetical protein [Anaerolineales bacterium]